MAEPLSLRLNIQSGVPHEDGPFTRVHPLRDGEHRAYLILVAEARGPDPEDASSWAMDRVYAGFGTRHRSATGRLQEALKGIHDALAQDNSLVFSSERTYLSLVCGYLRGQDLYLAHVGPALGYVIGPAGVRPLAPTAGHDGNWLGESKAPNIWVRHHRMEPGEILLLAGSELGASPAAVLAAFQDRIEAGMAEVYRKTRTQRAFGALAVALRSPEAAEEDGEPGTAREEAPYRYRSQLTAPGGARPFNSPPDNQAAAYPLLPSLDIDISMRPPPRRVSRWATQLLTPKLLAAVLTLFILGGLALGVQAMTQGMSEQSRQQTAALLGQARTLWDRARGSETADKRRELLNEAIRQVEAVQRQDPNSREAPELAEQLRQALAGMDAVTALRNVRRVVDFTAAIGSPVLLRSPVYQDEQLFVLDKLADRVYQVPLNTTQGDGVRLTVSTLRPSRNPARRNMAAVFWMSKGGAWARDSLFSMDDNRALQELSLTADPQSVPLRGAQDWSSLQTARGFAGNLYVLDPKASQVWRYAPTDSGFDSERRAALPSVDLSDGVDLLVDGDVYVLMRTGKVVRASSGRLAPFSLDGLDRPMVNATALGGGGANKQIYVADPGNKRIVAFDKSDGRFARQFATGDLPPVHHVWVDEASARLFLLTDSQLFAAGLPQ